MMGYINVARLNRPPHHIIHSQRPNICSDTSVPLGHTNCPQCNQSRGTFSHIPPSRPTIPTPKKPPNLRQPWKHKNQAETYHTKRAKTFQVLALKGFSSMVRHFSWNRRSFQTTISLCTQRLLPLYVVHAFESKEPSDMQNVSFTNAHFHSQQGKY